MSRRLPFLVAVAALSAAAALPAHAAATSSATLGPLTITLIDLNLTDGIDAAVSFTTIYPGYGSYVSAYASDTFASAYDSQSAWGVNDFDPVSIAATVGTAGGLASVTGPGGAAGATVSVSGSAAGTAAANAVGQYHSYYGATAYAPYYSYSGFTLSANTLLLVSATSTITGSVTASFDPATSYQYESVGGYTQLSLSGPGANGLGGSQSSTDSTSLSLSSQFVADETCTYGYCYGPASATDTRALTVSFVNASGGDLSGYLQAYANTNGYSYAQAIPEPQTYAMMMAGLLSLGFLARRRRQA